VRTRDPVGLAGVRDGRGLHLGAQGVFGPYSRAWSAMSGLQGRGPRYRQRKFRPVLSKGVRTRQGTFSEPPYRTNDRTVLGAGAKADRVDAMLRSGRLPAEHWNDETPRVNWLVRLWRNLRGGE
jgi:hypothetical protein